MERTCGGNWRTDGRTTHWQTLLDTTPDRQTDRQTGRQTGVHPAGEQSNHSDRREVKKKTNEWSAKGTRWINRFQTWTSKTFRRRKTSQPQWLIMLLDYVMDSQPGVIVPPGDEGKTFVVLGTRDRRRSETPLCTPPPPRLFKHVFHRNTSWQPCEDLREPAALVCPSRKHPFDSLEHVREAVCKGSRVKSIDYLVV